MEEKLLDTMTAGETNQTGYKHGGRIAHIQKAEKVWIQMNQRTSILEFLQDQGIPGGEMVEGGPTEEQRAMVIDMDGRGMGIDEIMSFTQLGIKRTF